MTSPHASYYADQLCQVRSTLIENGSIAQSTYRCRIDAPEIAGLVVPGQFVMLRMDGHDSPLIGRALAVWDVGGDDPEQPSWIDLIYLRKGRLTSTLADAPNGTPVQLWGPLGNGFATRPCDRLIITAGGIGQTPMLLLGREALGTAKFGDSSRAAASNWAGEVEIIYGARTSKLHAGVEDFREAGFEVTLCTDDGSAGLRARVPDVLADRLKKRSERESIRVVTCGPEIMMQKVAEICRRERIDCQVSMETPMACGIGICFSCVAKVVQEGDGEACWDYKRTCVEGPIFDAERIHWDD